LYFLAPLFPELIVSRFAEYVGDQQAPKPGFFLAGWLMRLRTSPYGIPKRSETTQPALERIVKNTV